MSSVFRVGAFGAVLPGAMTMIFRSPPVGIPHGWGWFLSALGAVLPGEGQLGHDHDVSPPVGIPHGGGWHFCQPIFVQILLISLLWGCGNLSAFLPLTFEAHFGILPYTIWLCFWCFLISILIPSGEGFFLLLNFKISPPPPPNPPYWEVFLIYCQILMICFPFY